MARQIDIGIITIRDDEFRAVLNVFPDEIGDGFHKGKHREYAIRQAGAGKAGHYSLAIVRLPEQGNGEAQDAARDLLEDLEPSLLLVVGIAGGLPSDDLTLGDVTLSTRINDYCVEARKEGAEPTYAISGGPIAKAIQTGIANLAAREKDLGNWTAGLPEKPQVSWTQQGQLYGPEDWQVELQAKLESHHGASAVARPPRFSAGPIASSDRLIKDPVVLFPWIQTARNLLAVEMESGGVYRAARDRCPMLAIRALSDIIGLKRANDWTKYAAASAAAFARAYLQTVPIPNTSSNLPPPKASDPPSGGTGTSSAPSNTLSITGGHVETQNLVVGVQNVYIGNGASTLQSLEALEKLVDNGLLSAVAEPLEGIERTTWASMSPVEKSRVRKLQARVLVRRGQRAAAAARYDEAASFVPADETAQVHRVTALILRDDAPAAHLLAGEFVTRFPSLASAKAAWIASAPEGACADDLLPKPWDGLDPEIARAIANRLLFERRSKEALEVLRRAHSSGVSVAYWIAYGVAALGCYEEDSVTLLAAALSALEKAYKLCGEEGLEKDKVQILLYMRNVHRLRNDLDEEWRVLRQAHVLDSEQQDVRVQMAQNLSDRGRQDEAVPIYEGLLEDGPEYVPLLLGVALAKRDAGTDLERAAELFERTANTASPSEPMLLLDGAEALVQASRKLRQWDRALKACTKFADVFGAFRATELAARIHLERGDAPAAQTILGQATMSDLTPEQRQALGILSRHAGDDERAVELLEPVAPRNEWAESTNALIAASQATGRHELIIRICRQLRSAGVMRDYLVDAEAAALHHRGELAAAIEVVEQALTSQENPFLRLRLSTLGIAAGRPALIEADPSRLPKPGEGDPHIAALVVGALRAGGAHDVAIRYGYDAFRMNRSSVDGWRAIIEAFIPTLGATNHVQPDVVAVDAAVLVREGSTRKWFIVEPDKPEAEHGELSPDNPLVVAMLGKRAGESFELPRQLAPPRAYVVDEIQSKYVRAYQQCLDQWEEQFPDVPGPVMMEISENLEDDIELITKQLTPLLQANARRVDEMNRLYQEKLITLHVLARGLRCSVFGAMSHLIAGAGIDVRCTRADAVELHHVLSTLDAGPKVILEASALSTLLLLEEADVITGAMRGRIAIAQATLDELRAHRREVETRGESHLGLDDGHLTMREIDRDSQARYLVIVDDLLRKFAECEVFREQEHDLIDSDDWDRLVSIGGAGAVESLHRALRTGEPIWCDDMVLSLLARQRGARVAWTQLLCHHLVARSAVGTERASRISAKLVGWRFVSTNTTPGIYREAARLAMWNPEHWPLKQHLRLFAAGAWSDDAAGVLAVNVLREWWRHAPSDTTANAVTVALLDRIAARPNGTRSVIPAISGVLERVFGIDVIGYQRARAAFDAWRSARPLRQGLMT